MTDNDKASKEGLDIALASPKGKAENLSTSTSPGSGSAPTANVMDDGNGQGKRVSHFKTNEQAKASVLALPRNTSSSGAIGSVVINKDTPPAAGPTGQETSEPVKE